MEGLTLFDQHLARFLGRLSGLDGADRQWFEDLLARLTQAMGAGHSCLTLDSEDLARLQGLALVSQTPATPLVLRREHLYFQRSFCQEQRLAGVFRALAGQHDARPLDAAALEACFPLEQGRATDQRRAAELAQDRALTLITGGPGTGKTTAVVRILGLLLLSRGLDLSIALAAPTGKAAMRLQESVAAQLDQLPLPDEVRARIPVRAQTLHRLLAPGPTRPPFAMTRTTPCPGTCWWWTSRP